MNIDDLSAALRLEAKNAPPFTPERALRAAQKRGRADRFRPYRYGFAGSALAVLAALAVTLLNALSNGAATVAQRGDSGPLEGRRWVLSAGSAASEARSGYRRPEFSIESGKLVMWTGINLITAEVTVNAQSLTPLKDQPVTTLVGCPDDTPACRIDAIMTRFAVGTAEYTLNGQFAEIGAPGQRITFEVAPVHPIQTSGG